LISFLTGRITGSKPEPKINPTMQAACGGDFSRPRTLISGLPVIQRADGRLKSPPHRHDNAAAADARIPQLTGDSAKSKPATWVTGGRL